MKVTIDGQIFDFPETTAPVQLSELLRRCNCGVALPCGGNQRCGKCKIRASGALSPITAQEEALLTREELEAGIRLACAAMVTGDITAQRLSARENSVVMTEGSLPLGEATCHGAGLGAALDIGTTTLAMYLYDKTAQTVLATLGASNPQSTFGADVISRIGQSIAGRREELAGVIRRRINEMLSQLCQQAGKETDEIRSMAVVGNTAMLYLLCGYPPDALAAAPFCMDRHFGREFVPQELGIALAPTARIYLSPCISAFTGGDITAALLYANLPEKATPALLADIGTNGEMALFTGKELLCCSAAAGPAFEGAGLLMGMNALPGAVSKVWAEGGKLKYSVTGGGEARGICGSGLVDALALMLEKGVLSPEGQIRTQGHGYTHFITQQGQDVAFRLGRSGVLITQSDIQAIQLAKAAICAGMLTLLYEGGFEQIGSFWIAGGFGSYIDPAHGEAIGLFPAGFSALAHSIGNAAGMGALLLLRDAGARKTAEQIVQNAREIQLSSHPFFAKKYMEAMAFGPVFASSAG